MTVDARVVPASSPAWVEALRRVPTDVFHLPHYAIVDAEVQGGRPAAFTYRDGDDFMLVPLVIRRVPDASCSDAISPYGYGGPTASTDDPEFWRAGLTAFQDALLEINVVACLLRLHPLMPTADDMLRRVAAVVEHGQTVSMDLTQDAEDVVAGIRTNHRRDIQRARSRGHQGVVDDWSLLPDFLEIYAETMDRVGATDQYRFAPSYVPSLRRALGDAVHLVSVVADDRTLAAGIFFEASGIVGYHLGATRTEALSLRPSKLMMDTAWRWAQRRGNHAFHLGGGLGGSAEGSLFHFKAGFSPLRHAFRTARLVLDVGAYEELCASVTGSHVPDQGGFFPAYRAPRAEAQETGQEGGPWLLTVT
jgi:hypothetical protein